jgi:hypothetical protein
MLRYTVTKLSVVVCKSKSRHVLRDMFPRLTVEYPRIERSGYCESLRGERTRENADRTADCEIDSSHDGSHVLDPAIRGASLSYGCREDETTALTSEQTVILSSSMVAPCHGKGRARFLPHSSPRVRLADGNGSENLPSSIKSRTTPFLVVSLTGEKARNMLWAMYTAFVALL